MHFSLILIIACLALVLRLRWSKLQASWSRRWQSTLAAFLIPPLLMLTTTLSVLCMGTQGTMLGLNVGWIGYGTAAGFLGFAGALLLHLGWQGWHSLRQVQTYAPVDVPGKTGRLLNSSTLFAAQVGFWHSELVISQGLLQTLNAEQLNAVLTHERAHERYRDTFWFFWLGWCRRVSAWLPKTEHLWQELLLLRELRADRWAAQSVDALLLAETLLLMVKAPLVESASEAAFSAAASPSRLEERIEALLSPPECDRHNRWIWLLGFLPLLTVLLHS